MDEKFKPGKGQKLLLLCFVSLLSLVERLLGKALGPLPRQKSGMEKETWRGWEDGRLMPGAVWDTLSL